MSDIVERLRALGPEWSPEWSTKVADGTVNYELCAEAADEIERLRAQILQLLRRDDE